MELKGTLTVKFNTSDKARRQMEKTILKFARGKMLNSFEKENVQPEWLQLKVKKFSKQESRIQFPGGVASVLIEATVSYHYQVS